MERKDQERREKLEEQKRRQSALSERKRLEKQAKIEEVIRREEELLQ